MLKRSVVIFLLFGHSLGIAQNVEKEFSLGDSLKQLDLLESQHEAIARQLDRKESQQKTFEFALQEPLLAKVASLLPPNQQFGTCHIEKSWMGGRPFQGPHLLIRFKKDGGVFATAAINKENLELGRRNGNMVIEELGQGASGIQLVFDANSKLTGLALWGQKLNEGVNTWESCTMGNQSIETRESHSGP